MKVKVKIQLGVYDKKPEDFFRLLDSDENLFAELALKATDFTVKRHRLPDGFTHLIEYEMDKVV